MHVPLLDLKLQYQKLESEINAAINAVVREQNFILGPQVKQLEDEIAAYCGTAYAAGVASGTDALLLALMALGVGCGDEVITTPYTFFATAGSVSRLGATPVFVDIDPLTYNIDPGLIEAEITPRTKAIMPVHLFGQCADMEPILDIARRHSLPVIEDAAQAIGAEYTMNDKVYRAGSMGDMGCFSFFPSKNLGGFGDAGMVVTNNQVLAEKIRMLRVHGSQVKYHHKYIGCNSRLDTLQAAVLVVKLKCLDEWHKCRMQNARYYDELCGVHEVDNFVNLPYHASYSSHIYNQFVIRAERRDELMQHLRNSSIGTEIYYPIPLHLQECYQSLGHKPGDYPEAEKSAQQTLALPIFPELTPQQQAYVVEQMGSFYRM